MVELATENEIQLPFRFIQALYESYQVMAEACLTLRDGIRADGEDYPVYVPTFGSSEADNASNAAREAAIKSMAQLFYLRPSSGIPPKCIKVGCSPCYTWPVELVNI